MTGRQQSFDFPAQPSADEEPTGSAGATERTDGPALVPLLFRATEADTEEAARLALEARLAARLGEPVALTVTDNRHTMISSGRRGEYFVLRLHRMFLEADDRTIRALSRYLVRSDRRASARLDEFIEANSHRIRKTGRRRTSLRTQGEHHDLEQIFVELNRRWFDDVVDVHVTWSRRSPRKRRRSIRLGTYVGEDRLIRIHPVLDALWVPRYFVRYVLFHEMLHAVIPAPTRNGRQRFHSREFRERERAYPDYERAIEWERRNLRRLLTD